MNERSHIPVSRNRGGGGDTGGHKFKMARKEIWLAETINVCMEDVHRTMTIIIKQWNVSMIKCIVAQGFTLDSNVTALRAVMVALRAALSCCYSCYT